MPGRPTIGKIIRRLLLVGLIILIVLNWTAGRLPKQPAAPSDAKYAQIGETKIHYQEQPGKDPAVVMVHGLPGVWANWDPVVPKLPGRHTIVIDRPGFGFSSGDYMPYDEQLTTIHALVAKLKLKKPVIAGFSYGGTLALGYARKYPAETKSIVLVDAAAKTGSGHGFEKVQARAIKLLETPGVRQVWNATLGQLFKTASAKAGAAKAFSPTPVDDDFQDQVLDYNMQSDDLKAYADEVINFSHVVEQLQPTLPQIRTPAFILQGKGDELVDPDTATYLKKVLPNSSLVLVPGGHVQPYISPQVVAGQIKLAVR
ncbi:MAG: alpha/beta fold hydrolase [Solirubrobacterales bacterium]